MIYLDNNATTRPLPEVIAAVNAALTETWHNPSSTHRAGQNAKHAIENARADLARLIGARPRELTFTGTGTEAIDLAIRGTLDATKKKRIVTTSIEHHAIGALCERVSKSGIEIHTVAVDQSGVVDATALANAINEHTAMVSVQWVNNETGAIQPIIDIAKACNELGVVFHCDATQAVGKLPINLGDPSMPRIDLLNFAPHKFHGPKGVGVLRMARGAKLVPTIVGTQELGRRGGTEPVPAIAGAGAAARLALDWLYDPSNRTDTAALRDRLESGILDGCPGAVVNATTDPDYRLWSTTNIGFPRLEAEALLLLLSEQGVCVSAGSACASGSLEPSPVLLAMGIDEQTAHGSVRLSLSRETTPGEIDEAIKIVCKAVDRLSDTLPGK
ncbi:MAG: cysteine desulfurase [Phycisphaerales bacterium]|nr:cysteine desulfurase [Phycisphaerales bacterium]